MLTIILALFVFFYVLPVAFNVIVGILLAATAPKNLPKRGD